MTSAVKHPLYGDITYNENFWSGKKTISINGVSLVKQKKNNYLYEKGFEKIQVTLKGNFFVGVKLEINGEAIELIKAPEWYEFVCSIFIAVFVITWGNSAYLCSIVPVVGGAIGGAVAGVMAVSNVIIMKSIKSILAKIFAWLGMLIASLFVCFVLAMLIAAVLV